MSRPRGKGRGLQQILAVLLRDRILSFAHRAAHAGDAKWHFTACQRGACLRSDCNDKLSFGRFQVVVDQGDRKLVFRAAVDGKPLSQRTVGFAVAPEIDADPKRLEAPSGHMQYSNSGCNCRLVCSEKTPKSQGPGDLAPQGRSRDIHNKARLLHIAGPATFPSTAPSNTSGIRCALGRQPFGTSARSPRSLSIACSAIGVQPQPVVFVDNIRMARRHVPFLEHVGKPVEIVKLPKIKPSAIQQIRMHLNRVVGTGGRAPTGRPIRGSDRSRDRTALTNSANSGETVCRWRPT